MVKVSPAVNCHSYPVVALASRLHDHRVADARLDGRARLRDRRHLDGLAPPAPAAGRQQRRAQRGQRQPPSPSILCALSPSTSPDPPPGRAHRPVPLPGLRDAPRLSCVRGRGYHPGKGTAFALFPTSPTYRHGRCPHPLRRDHRRRRPRRHLRRARARAPRRRPGAARRARPRHQPPRLPGAQDRRVHRLRALRHHLRLGRRRRLQRRQAHADARRGRLARPASSAGSASPSSSSTSTASGWSTAPRRRSTAAARRPTASAARPCCTA